MACPLSGWVVFRTAGVLIARSAVRIIPSQGGHKISDPIWYEEDPDDLFVFADDWKILPDGTNEPGGGLSFTEAAQDATLVGYVPFNKIRSAARYFLGFSYADTGSPWLLYREPPAVHPQMPNLRCYGGTFGGYALKANFDNSDDPLYPNAPFKLSPFVGADGGDMWYTTYQLALVTLKFKSFGRMRFTLDDDVFDYSQEIERYTRTFSDSAVQTLSVDGRSMLKFAEGPLLNPRALPFPAPVAQLLAKVSLRVLWAQVPHDYVSADANFLLASKLIERLGTVNNAAYMGNPKGTLLFTSFQAEEMLFPVLAFLPTTGFLTGWNITLCFEQFDPPKGVPDSEYRGHRIFPYSIGQKWFFANRSDDTELFPLTDYNKLTQHVLDPS
jgi:hypothetical protein